VRGRRQEQQGGDSSINLQASGNISVGLTYDETRQVVMDTFQANFVELRNDAFALVLERAEALLTS